MFWKLNFTAHMMIYHQLELSVGWNYYITGKFIIFIILGQVACETLRGPVTTGLYHEGSTSTGVKEGGPPSPKAMTAIKVRVIASLL